MYSDLTNKRFGTLLVIRLEEKTDKHKKWRVRCDCGLEKVVFQQHLLSGKTKSCNHKQHEQHSMSQDPTYSSYLNMKDRCLNPNNPEYENYGGRGITIYEPWINSFSRFFLDVGKRPHNTTLDRIRVNGNYEPGNVRWVNNHIQNLNRRSSNLKKMQFAFDRKEPDS